MPFSVTHGAILTCQWGDRVITGVINIREIMALIYWRPHCEPGCDTVTLACIVKCVCVCVCEMCVWVRQKQTVSCKGKSFHEGVMIGKGPLACWLLLTLWQTGVCVLRAECPDCEQKVWDQAGRKARVHLQFKVKPMTENLKLCVICLFHISHCDMSI